MSEARHTPGPWHIDPRKIAAASFDIPILASSACSAIALACDLYARDGGALARDANAQLIAAAPEILAELLTTVGHIEHMAAWIGKQNAGYSFESLGEDMPGIRAAIAKATGVTP